MQVKGGRVGVVLCTALIVLCALCAWVTLAFPSLLTDRAAWGLYVPERGPAVLVDRRAWADRLAYVAYYEDGGVSSAQVLGYDAQGYQVAGGRFVPYARTLGRVRYELKLIGEAARALHAQRLIVWGVSALCALLAAAYISTGKRRYKRRYQKQLIARFNRYGEKFDREEAASEQEHV